MTSIAFYINPLYFQTLSVTDDTVLEEHNEDPTLIQMHLIDDGGECWT